MIRSRRVRDRKRGPAYGHRLILEAVKRDRYSVPGREVLELRTATPPLSNSSGVVATRFRQGRKDVFLVARVRDPLMKAQ